MKNFTKIASILVSCLILSSCSSVNTNQANLPVTNSTVASYDVNSSYLITAKAIIDKMPNTTSVAEQDKLVKDFTQQIKNLNRPALDGLLKYSVKVLQATTPAGQDLLKMPLIKLIHEAQSRYLDVFTNSEFMKRSDDIFSIALMKNPADQEKALQKFEKLSFKSTPKTDLKLLISYVKGDLGNFEDFLDPNSPIAKRIISKLESYL